MGLLELSCESSCLFSLDTDLQTLFAQSAEAVEYTNCFSKEGWDTPPTTTTYILDRTLTSLMLVLWGMQSTPSLPSFLLWLGVVAPDRVLSMGQIEQNCLLMLNWIAWNTPRLTFKLRTYAKLNCLKWGCLCMLNWIVWNRNAFDFETLFTLKWIVWNGSVLAFNCV